MLSESPNVTQLVRDGAGFSKMRSWRGRRTGGASGFLRPSPALPWTLHDLAQDTFPLGLGLLLCTMRMKVRLCWDVLGMV